MLSVKVNPDSVSAERCEVVVDGQVILQFQDVPAGIKYGINYIDEQTVILSLYAPEKENVFAVGEFNNWQISEASQMKVSSDLETYWIEISDLISGQEYAFQYLVASKKSHTF